MRRFLEIFKQKYWKYFDWRNLKGLSSNQINFVHMLNFAIIGGLVCFILVTRVQKRPNPLNLPPKNGFSWEQKVASLGGRNAQQRDRKDADLGARRRRRTHILWDKSYRDFGGFQTPVIKMKLTTHYQGRCQKKRVFYIGPHPPTAHVWDSTE